MPESTQTDTNTLLQQILDQIALRPTAYGLSELTFHLETQFNSAIEESSTTIQDRLEDIVRGTNQLPGMIGQELSKKLKEIVQSITAKDQIFLSEISKQRKAIEALTTNQLSSSTSIIQQIFDLKDMIRQQNDRTDNAMAMVHSQQQAADVLVQQQRADISASQSQMQELLQAVQHLTDLFNDDNKGEKTITKGQSSGQGSQGKGKGQSSVQGKGRGQRVTEEDRGRGQGQGVTEDRGRGSSSSYADRGRGGSVRGRSRYPPPPSRPEIHSSRASSSRPTRVEDDLRRWSEEIKIKEEQALLREEEELRKEEEDREHLLRRPRDRR